ncbi:MAG: trypsin-like peptidase domain-containing protein [Lachnospiraceae bacterium]|nr:trypsin-like peptidase domain-containing protein [Lachnospiraceae bacterium]
MDNNIFNHNSDWNNNADNQNVSNQTNIYAGTTDYTGQSGNMEINMTDAMYNNDQYYQNNNQMEHQWQPYSAPQLNVQNYGDVSQKKKKEKKEKVKKPLSYGKVLGTCVAFMMTTIIVNTAIIYVAFDSMSDNFVSKTQYASENIGSTSDTINNILTETSSGLTVAQVADAVMPSVVAITSTSIVEQSANPFYGYGGSYQIEGAGSGIIVGKNDTELLIVTNNHVVEDTTSLSVQFTNDVSVDRAYVKGTSADNDIAVVAIPIEAIDTDTLNYIKIATLGDSDALHVGDGVIAIGNALGYGQSLTVGYVSAKDRDITIDNNTLTVIQTDAAINGGNSGGALLNMNGEVIGINVAKSSSSDSTSASVEGMGYAIPITEAKEVIEELSNKETRYPVAEEDKGYMGVKVVTSDSSSASYYNIPEGAYIREVTAGGPADKAGLAGGDVIVAVEGDDVSTSEELIDILDTYAAGETITVTVMMRDGRSYEEKDVQITLVGYDDIQGIN